MKTTAFYQKSISSLFFLAILSAANSIMAKDMSEVAILSHFETWPRATDEELEQLKGGFILPNGVHVDLSLVKSIYLNGVETFSSSLKFPDDGLILQNMGVDLGASALSSVIQNNLDNQLISAITELNVTISNLKALDLIDDSSRVFTDFIVPGVR